MKEPRRHGSEHVHHRGAVPRRPRRRTIVAVGILAVALAAAAAAILFGPSGGIRFGGGDAASDFLLRCEQHFSRGAWSEAFQACSVALAKPARVRIHVEAARRMALSRLALGDTGSAAAIVRTLETQLDDQSSGAIRGLVQHMRRGYGAAAAAYRDCQSRNPLLERLREEAQAARRPRLDVDLVRDIARIRCA